MLILFPWEISHSKIVKALMFQEKIIDELGNEMDNTSNRLARFCPSEFLLRVFIIALKCMIYLADCCD